MATEIIGWAAALVLLLTIAAQVLKQWRGRSSQGVSPWLFSGQVIASAGFTVYSVLLGNAVFAVEGMKGPVFSVKAGGQGDVSSTNLAWKTKAKGATPDASTPTPEGNVTSSKARYCPARRSPGKWALACRPQ